MRLSFAEFKVILEDDNFITVGSVSGACEGSWNQ